MSWQSDRRGFLKALGLSVISLRAQDNKTMQGVKAIVFDTFGTLVDWRGSIIEEGAVWGKAKGLHIDWGHFADRWRAGYGPAMSKVRSGAMPWTKLDDLHRMILDSVLVEFGIAGL